ncbi:hypothetical protein IAQ61_008773 [Plenodomus lingam]|uniref:uncharacterized protein n=1 Tax=Leptosphaeria maculans TaxID=5022 RepID=UPI00331FBA77|nr:hypothetical protein IAQ61_008773 [Plenodomus lingam]
MAVEKPRILLYILRRDVRLSDNPVFHAASQQTRLNTAAAAKAANPSPQSDRRGRDDSLTSEHASTDFTHLLPVYVFPANQVEISGFLSSPSDKNPYPEARSQVAKIWRTGPHRIRFMAEGAWDLKRKLESLKCGSGLEMRVGAIPDVVSNILEWYSKQEDSKGKVTGVWMTDDDGTEEKSDEKTLKSLTEKHRVDFKVYRDEKYYVDECVIPALNISELPNVYTSYRKALEPLRDRPRNEFPAPTQLPPLPEHIPPQQRPFTIPDNLDALLQALSSPLEKDPTYTLSEPPKYPTDVQSAHPFAGGETSALNRVSHLISSGAMSSYKETRNGMLGLDFSTKLSAFLAQGHLTARHVHWAMFDFEEGRGPGKDVKGYGQGENAGTAAVRFELLWRDYMRLCMRKFGDRMFHLYGIQNQDAKDGNRPQMKKWKKLDGSGGAGDDPKQTLEAFTRFRSGRTGVGLIDASNRELFVTGYTSNRARQNVASFLASHLNIDWRIGAEWYECFLTDYDCASNWGNWQYVAGVGNDPRQGRVFNPVKQAFDYDPKGEYIKAWVPELRGIKLTRTVGNGKEEVDQQRLMNLFQAWRLSDWEKNNLGLKGVEWVEQPLTKIQFTVGRGRGGQGDNRPRRGGGGGPAWRGRGRGGSSQGPSQNYGHGSHGYGQGQDRNYSQGGYNHCHTRHEQGPTIVSSG